MTLYRALRFLLKPLIKILWPTKIVGKERYDAFGGGLVVINHYSKIDAIIPTTDIFKRELNVLTKSEAFEESKISDWFLKKMGCIPVHRGDADIDAVKTCLKVLREDRQLIIFPEGTRNKAGTKEMAEFKQGPARFAIKTKKPVLPMIYYKMPKTFSKNYLYVGEPIFLESFYGSRTQEEYDKATDYIYQKMVETRRLCDEYVEGKKAPNSK